MNLIKLKRNKWVMLGDQEIILGDKRVVLGEVIVVNAVMK